MKKTKIFFVLAGLLSICACCLFASSCQDDVNNSKTIQDDGIDASSFMTTLGGNVNSFMEASVVVNSFSDELESVKTRGTISINPKVEDLGVTRVYVDLSLAEEPINLKKISTPGQIVDLVKTFGAEISLENDGTFEDSLLISEEESLEALNPLIQDSKKYLYGKGFTESEIQEMLAENNVDESALVPFVLILMEGEEYQLNNNIQPLSRQVNIDWGRVGKCAMEAVGADLIYSFNQSATKTWSKVILKKTFKTVASRVLGPVGVAIAVISFSICCWG